jgi:DNA-binding LacI/PurR family transcriptional regulator
LVELVRRGHLESSRRSGHFLTDEALRAAQEEHKLATTATALMVINGPRDEWGEQLRTRYMTELRRACARIEWELLEVDNRADQIEAARKGRKIGGCLAYGVNAPPAVSIDPASVITWTGSWYNPACCTLMADGESAAKQAFEHLWDLGHQHTALVRLPDERPGRRIKGSILGMRKAYASMGHAWTMGDVFSVAPHEMEGLYERLRERGITGIYSLEWQITLEIYRQAHRLGHKIGDQLSIVASGGHDLAEAVDPRPARVHWRFEDYASIVVDAAENLCRGKRLPPRLIIPPLLEEGPGAKMAAG